MVGEIALAIPAGSLEWWREQARRARASSHMEEEQRFGERVLPFRDPHGLALALVEIEEDREFAVWGGEARCLPSTRSAASTRCGSRSACLPPSVALARGGCWAFAASRATGALASLVRPAGGRGRSRISRRRPRPRSARWGTGGRAPRSAGEWRTTKSSSRVRAAVEASGAPADAGHRSVLVPLGVLQGAGWDAVRAGHGWPWVRPRRRRREARRDARPPAVARSGAGARSRPRCRRSKCPPSRSESVRRRASARGEVRLVDAAPAAARRLRLGRRAPPGLLPPRARLGRPVHGAGEQGRGGLRPRLRSGAGAVLDRRPGRPARSARCSWSPIPSAKASPSCGSSSSSPRHTASGSVPG